MESTTSLPLNAPTMLTIRKNGAELRTYAWERNITGTVTNSTMVNNAATKCIGAADGGIQNFFLGTIDEVAFFRSALSDSDILALVEAARTIALEAPVETDSAPSVSVAPAQFVALSLATETDSAPTVSITNSVSLEAAREADSAPEVTPRPAAVSLTLSLATEMDSALIVAPAQTISLSLASETDNANELRLTPGATTRTLEVARENDSAPTVTLDATYGSPTEILSLDFEGDRFLSTIARSHRAAIRATLLRGNSSEPLGAVLDGTVTLDAKAATRGRADVTVVDNGTLDLIPTESGDWLVPYGTEIKLERGVHYNESEIEYAPLGVYRIQDVDVEDKGETIEIRVSGFDRSQRVIDARFEEPYQIASGVNHDTAILSTIQLIYPEVEYDFATVSTSTTSTIIAEEGSDRWAFCQNIATSLGMELFFDNDGMLILRPVPMVEALSVPVWEITDGARGVQVNIGRNWTREGSFNRVIATGENMGDGVAPVRGVATDTNASSPTYYFGPFGRVPRFYQSEFLTTNAQALSAATGILARELGTTQRISFGTIVNPKLVPGDVVLVHRERIGIREELHVIDTLTIPLAVTNTMSGNTRATVVT